MSSDKLKEPPKVSLKAGRMVLPPNSRSSGDTKGPLPVLFFCLLAPTVWSAPVSYEREVVPLLEQRCNKCHHPEEQRGGLDLTRLDTMLRGGDDLGAAIVPGKAEKSPLIQVLTGEIEPEMPKKGEKLAPAEIDLLRRWIAEGAKDDSTVFANHEVAFFEREIRPVLAARCFKCHAGEDAEHGLRLTSRQSILMGGERGPAAIAGQPAESLLLRAIRHEGELKMPRGGDRLSAAQASAFEQWIAMGMPWPKHEKVLAREKLFTISEAERNHWAFRPLPESLPSDWSVDGELARHQAKAGLKGAPEADRHRLLRRVTYDLIGYPPTAEEIAAFVGDTSPDAFEKVVTRLLASSHFGWRWGRHWLDYTRNGANSQPNRGPALNASRYAAWVAQCFNEDRPWDWFARVHLAGDKMKAFDGADYSVDQALAAAVPLNGQRTFEDIGAQTFVLMDKLDEGVEFLGRSLMGISLECARCHDHKFDPVSQRDYYSLLGIFQSSYFAPVPVNTSTRADAGAAVARYRELVSERARLNGFIQHEAGKARAASDGLEKRWKASRPAILVPMDKRLRELEIMVLRAELAEAEQQNAPHAADLRDTLAERETKLQNHRAPEYTNFGSIGGNYFYFISGHKTQVGLIKRATKYGLTELVRELEQQHQFWVEERERWIERSRFGGYTKADPEVAELARASDRIVAIEAELGAHPIQPWLAPKASHLYVRADGGLRRLEDLKSLDNEAKAAGLQFNSNNPERVWLHPYYIGDARLLLRGDPLYPDKLVPRGVPEFFGRLEGEIEDSGRLQLAEWLTKPGSAQAALVARTVANRAWQHLFGEALCRTPKELGRLGEAPELPELIDGLAVRFIAQGWSVKKLIREIVLSRAYRRSAVAAEEDLARDPDNRLFARRSVRRIEYEPILNTMAWLKSGTRFDSPVQRDAAVTAVSEYARHFDGPPVYDLIDRRVASISATQALFLMNNASTARAVAGDLVTRLGCNSQTALAQAMDPLYAAVLQRPPTEEERGLAQRFVDRRRSETGAAQPADEIREFTSLLLCGNETIYLE